MASSSGNSCGSSVEERKRKRMQSNRESARRSRMRKQQRLDELVAEAVRLRRDNARVAAGVSVAARHVAVVEAENSVLRAQMSELAQRLRSLNDIVCFVEGGGGGGTETTAGFVLDYSLARFSHCPFSADNIASADMMFY